MANNGFLSSRTITALRFPCAIAVVLIHVFNFAPDVRPSSLFAVIEVALSHGLCRIAVPVFFFISGYLFFSRLKDWDWSFYFGKLRKRGKTLLVPYLLWVSLAILWLVAYHRLTHLVPGEGAVSLGQYLSDNGWGLMYWNCARHFQFFSTTNILGWEMPSTFPYNYPLWFIRDLIVLCVFAPVIHFAVRKTKGWILAVLYPLYLMNIWIPLDGFSPEGWFFFSLGAFLRLSGKDPVSTFRRFQIPSYVALAVATVLCVLTYGSEGWPYARCIITLPGLVAAFNLTANLLQKGIVRDHAFLAECSFPVFAGHTVGLTTLTAILFNKLFPELTDFTRFLIFLLRPAIIIVIIVAAFYLAKRFLPRTTALFTGGRS